MDVTSGRQARRKHRGLAFLVVATLLPAACKGPAEHPVRPREVILFPGVERTPTADILLALPPEIAGLRAGRQVVVSSRSDRGLGSGATLGFAMDRPERRSADVELIELPPGVALGDGVETPAVTRELNRARGEQRDLALRIPISPAMPVADVLDAAGRPVLRCIGYHMGGHLPETRDTIMSVVHCAGLARGRLLRVTMTRAGLPLRELQHPPPAPAVFGRALVAALCDDAGQAGS